MKPIPPEIKIHCDAALVKKGLPPGRPTSPRFTTHPDFDIPICDFKAENSLVVVNWYMK